MTKHQWFENWFDSPYYHILYKHRSQQEAELFIDHLISFLKPTEHARFLDLACGKGRHAVYLNKKGYDVTGLDLSPENIRHAAQYENEKLHFFVHDMRKASRVNYFDYTFNLFTSFGYFANKRDDLAVIDAIYKGLKPGGIFVIDFLNVKKTALCLTAEETQTIDDIKFKISKKIENAFIVKHIEFSDKGKDYHFREQLKMLTLSDFEKYFSTKKLKIVNLFGNYELEGFDEKVSERLIIIAQK